MDRHSAVRHRRHHLTQALGPYIAHGEHAGNIGLSGLSGQNIAAGIQLQLSRTSSVVSVLPTLMNRPSQSR